jgi:hypothetical protein
MSFFVIKNKKEAFKELVFYQKKRKLNGLTLIEGSLCGFLDLPSSKVIPKELLSSNPNSNYIFKGLGKSTFSTIPELIPKGFKRVKINSEEWALNTYLSKYTSPEKIHELNSKGFELNEWIQHYQSKWLTIADIINLPLNKKVKLLLLDRNIFDDKNKFKEATLYKPNRFFSKNTATYWRTSSSSLQGKILYNGNKELHDFEFDIEYKPNQWYPLKDGVLPEKDEQGIFTLLGEKKSLNNFSTDTHIGWRGPMILWDKVKDLDKVYIL